MPPPSRIFKPVQCINMCIPLPNGVRVQLREPSADQGKAKLLSLFRTSNQKPDNQMHTNPDV